VTSPSIVDDQEKKMTFSAADPIASGKPCAVVGVSDRAPQALTDFVGEGLTLSVDCSGRDTLVAGCGSQTSDGVRFYEKDAHTGKDVRTWMITDSGAGEFSALTVS